MKVEEAMRIFLEPDRIGSNIITAKDGATAQYNWENQEALRVAFECMKYCAETGYEAPTARIK